MMASGGPPENHGPAFSQIGSHSEPRPKRRPPRYGGSLDTELSLNTELRKAEEEIGHRSLPNNLEWSLGSSGSGNRREKKSKVKHFEQVKLQDDSSNAVSSPPEFLRRRRHTPATIPRTKFPPGTPIAEKVAMAKVCQQLKFDDDGKEKQPRDRRSDPIQVRQENPSSQSAANNERVVLSSSHRGSATLNIPLPGQETNFTDSNSSGTSASKKDCATAAERDVETGQVLERLRQVRDFLKQATTMFVALQETESQSGLTTQDQDQASKLARLIKHLKQQEKAYLDLLQRTIAVQDDSTLDNTPSHSMQSLTEEEKSDVVESSSIRDEELQGLRTQHALLKKMLQQQQQLKELQSRQATLLALQQDAERKLASAEEEGLVQAVLPSQEGASSSAAVQPGTSITSATPSAKNAQGSLASSVSAQALDPGNAADDQFTRDQLQLLNLLRRPKEKLRADNEVEKDEDEKLNQRRMKNQSVRGFSDGASNERESVNADNEEAALALADATQERLELENKLMALQAKKEQMDTLLGQLQALRTAQLNKGMLVKESEEKSQAQGTSVNESRQEEDEPPLATMSQKLDDDSILEALEVHEKLKKLQEVRDRLNQLNRLLGYYQPPVVESGSTTRESSRRESVTGSANSEPESAQGEDEDGEGGREGAAAVRPVTEIDWILNAGIHDPELSRRLRELQAARQRVGNLKQTNETVQTSSRANNENARRESVQTQTSGRDESDAVTQTDTDAVTQTDTDAEGSVASGVSSSLNALVWQDDPVFQEKVEKLNSAKKKLKQLQELVKKVNQRYPDQILPTLPMELAELSFDDDGDNEEGDQNESDEHDNSTEEQEPIDGGEASEDDDAATLSEGELSENKDGEAPGVEQATSYQRRLEMQKEELGHLLQERQRLLRVQQELTRISSKHEEQLQHKKSTTTQTPFYGSELRQARLNKSYSVDSSEPVTAPAAPGSNTLLWSELRRQREMHEEKLKKRKQRFVIEKRKKAGLDDQSEGGTYSVRSGRSADVDEGFGVSMMSADITTATWGGSTQPSSTQNDSAVSADGSDVEHRGEITVEVEDEFPNGILQAEEEEERDTFTGEPEKMFSSRRAAPSLHYEDSREPQLHRVSGKKRKLNGRTLASIIRKRDRERALTFQNWPKTTFVDDEISRNRGRESFSPGRQMGSSGNQEEFKSERQMWEKQCHQLHQEIGNLTALCNNLLRDHQTLVSTIINRSTCTPLSQPSTGVGNPFTQYQQRQQNAFEGIQQYFDEQRHLIQQQQLIHTLTQCFQQLQQQQQDMAILQQNFQQLFAFNPLSNAVSASPHSSIGSRPQITTPLVPPGAGSNLPPSLFPSFQGLPRPVSSGEFPQTAAVATSGSSPFHIQPPAGTSPSATTISPDHRQPFSFGAPAVEVTSQSMPQGAGAGINSTDVAQRFGRHPVEPAPQPASMGQTLPANSTAVPVVSGIITGNETYNPDMYTETTGEPNLSARTEQLATDQVVGRSFPTPLRASAAANLAKKAGLKVAHGRTEAIKREIESVETSSIASGLSSIAGEDKKATSEGGSDFSLFEALRDSIYSEVATLISLNESRPHFLIELFRELQLLTSDYLRQRALYALQDLVTRFLTEDSVAAGTTGPLVTHSGTRFATHSNLPAWVGSVSEHTPSEIVETSENELENRDATVEAQKITEGIYDYAENVESGSTLSTPTSSQAGESPFASEGLGDTVIHLDKALSKMREFERLKAEGKVELVACQKSSPKVKLGLDVVKDDVTTSSAGDIGSESSVSDVQYPRIDTQALDHQIKTIMSEVIPYLNEHMEDICSSHLMGYIKNLVISRLQVNEDKEFGRFFHKQLESILQDSLSKFVGQRLKECGEDMLIDMSEILFNELAFFRLMQDLDNTGGQNRRTFWRQGYESTSDVDTSTVQVKERERDIVEDREDQRGDSEAEGAEGSDPRIVNDDNEGDDEEEEDEVDETSSSSSSSDSGEDSDAEDEGADDEQEREELPLPRAQIEAEEEALGKERDDDMAAKFEERQLRSDKNSVESQQFVKVELSVSESKPFASAGSGEEDGNESFDDSEVRRKLKDYEGGTAASAAATNNRPENPTRGGGRKSSELVSDSAEENGAPQDEQVQAAAAEGYLHNGQFHSQEEIEVAIDDLPTKLTGLTEADARIAEEQSRNVGAADVLEDMNDDEDDDDDDDDDELVGNQNVLNEADGGQMPVNGLMESE